MCRVGDDQLSWPFAKPMRGERFGSKSPMSQIFRSHSDSRTRHSPRLSLIPSIVCIPILAVLVSAERLPIKTYTTNDGLARDAIVRIRQDSHGFLWFCTLNGLSRFDGYRFENYNVEQGLPDPRIYDLLETRNGTYWIATQRGVARFNPDPLHRPRTTNSDGSLFTTYLISDNNDSNNVNILFEDSSGQAWVGTAGGLFRLEETRDGMRFIRPEIR